MTMLSNNLWYFPQFVNKGDLDYYLIRPVSSLFFLSLRDFAANSFLNLLIAIGLIVWAIGSLPVTPPLWKILMFGLLILMGTFLYYCVRMALLIAVFWTHSSRGLDQLFFNIVKFMERPDRIYFGASRIVLVTILPFCLMASFPARLFLEGFSLELFSHLVAVIALLFGILLLVWNRALRAYASASS
jgi:ABC-2 type transport system permease protein